MEEERLSETPRAKKLGKRHSQTADHFAAPAEPTEDEHGTDDIAEMTEDEFFANFEQGILQDVLPALPPMPGYHVCWLSTSNVRDTVQNRLRMGYQLIRPEMLQGWASQNIKTGELGAVVQVNEMIAARIPQRLYERIMKRLHHEMPLAEEGKLRAQVEGLREQAESMGARLTEGDGMAELGRRAPNPSFAPG